MRTLICISILLLISFNSAQVTADDNLVNIAPGSSIEFDIVFSSLWSEPSTARYTESYELRDDNYQSPNSDLIDQINKIDSTQEFDNIFYDLSNYLYFNYTRLVDNVAVFSDPQLSVIPFYPGDVIIIKDWQYYANFGSIYYYSIDDKSSELSLIDYQFHKYDNGYSIDIATSKDQFYGDNKANYTIHTLNIQNMHYDIDSNILQWLYIRDYKFNHTLYSSRKLQDDYYSKKLTNATVLFSPKNHDAFLPLNQIIAYSLLTATLASFVYMEKKRRSHLLNMKDNRPL